MEISDLANEMTFSTGNAKGTFLRNLTTNALTLPLAYPRFKNSEQNFFALALKSHLRLQMRPKHQSLEVTIPNFDRSETGGMMCVCVCVCVCVVCDELNPRHR